MRCPAMLLMNDSVSLSENISCESGLILKCRIFFYISIICFHICDVPFVVFGHATSTIALLTAILVSWSLTEMSQQVLDRPLWIFFAGPNDFGDFLLHRWHIEFLLIQSYISTLTGFVGTNFCSDINCSWARTSEICDLSKLCHQLWDGFAWNLEHILLPL